MDCCAFAHPPAELGSSPCGVPFKPLESVWLRCFTLRTSPSYKTATFLNRLQTPGCVIRFFTVGMRTFLHLSPKQTCGSSTSLLETMGSECLDWCCSSSG